MRNPRRPFGLALLGLTALAAAQAPVAEPSEAARVIVSAATTVDAVVADVEAAGGTVEQTHDALGMVTALVDARGRAALAKDADVADVTVDSSVSMSRTAYQPESEEALGVLSDIVQVTQADDFHKDGFTGAGIDIALIDTGISPVPGLDHAGKIVHALDVSFDRDPTNTEFVDDFGHGTHLAGIIAGAPDQGAERRESGNKFRDPFGGIAPGARLINVKAGDQHGAADVSQMIAALDWIIDNRQSDGMNIRVINVAFGTDSDVEAARDPLTRAVEQAWDAGIAVVVSAGNRGDALGRLDSPATSPVIIAVGAVDTNGSNNDSDATVAPFSSVGDGVRDPDVVAPGASIMSLRSPGSFIDDRYPDARRSDELTSGGGTSQAAAVVSGLAALVFEAHPTWTPDQLKLALVDTAEDLLDGTAVDGAGLVQVKDIRDADDDEYATHVDGPRSDGSGTLDDARGSRLVTFTGLLGIESTIDGNETWNGSTWNGSTWNGSTWNGSTWNGSTWNGSTWNGSTWNGSTWNGSNWNGFWGE